jgi:hypothetical protein
MAFVRRNWEVFVFLAVGLLLLESLAVVKAAPLVGYRFGLVGELLSWFDTYFQVVTPVVAPVSIVLACVCCAMPAQSPLRRSLIDYYALFYLIRVFLFFILLNILLFARTTDAELLVVQLVLFLPSLLLIWGWIYWRFDLYSLRSRGQPMFLFLYLGETTPIAYDYFLASFVSLLSNTLAGFAGRTRLSRTLIFIHGIMMWDVMGLILSRAIALAVR